jgi:hypothetical protein
VQDRRTPRGSPSAIRVPLDGVRARRSDILNIMDEVVNWAGFVGAWLLVAGPTLQGAMDLHRIERSSRKPGQRLPSRWWWLLPPVMYVLSRSRFRDGSSRSREFRDSGTGWFYVAGGGALLAAKETYDLAQIFGWGTISTVVVYVAALAICTLITTVRMVLVRGLDSDESAT